MRNEELRQHLRAIESAEGTLTPQVVEKLARAKDHPLHSCFEWNDRKAALSWRIEQARRLIRSVMVEHRIEERTIRAPVYVRDPEVAEDEAGYVAVSRLRRNEDSAHAALVYEFTQAGAHLRRARDLAVVLGHADKVGDLIKKYDEVGAQIGA